MLERVEEMLKGDEEKTPGGDIHNLEEPPWLDQNKFRRVREIYKAYFASVNFSHLCGLLLSFYFTKNIKTLYSTGMSNSTRSLFSRYMATIRHIQSWYEGNVWDLDDKGRKSLFMVRGMHTRAANMMSERRDGIVYVSQWDMVLTQWAFLGPMLLFPSQVGLHDLKDEDFDALIHFWRGIGYLLGVQDRYNLCNGNLDEVTKTCQKILNDHYRVKVFASDPSSVTMGKSVVLAFSKISPLYTFSSLSKYIHEMIDVPSPFTMSIVDWINYYVFCFLMCFVTKFRVPRTLLNELTKWQLDIAEGNTMSFEKAFRKTASAIHSKLAST